VNATTTAETARRTTAAKVVGSLGVVAVAAAVAGLGVFGSFTDSTQPAMASVTNGVVSIDLAAAGGAGAAVPLRFASMVPGSVRTQAVDLVNNGDSGLSSITLATVATTSSLLDSDRAKGLQTTVRSCSVAWSADWTCAGAVRTVLAPGPVVRTVALTDPASLTAGAVDHLAVTVTFPAAAGNEFKHQSSELQLVFSAVQRDGSAR